MRTTKVGDELVMTMISIAAYPDHSSEKVAEDGN